MIISVSQAPKRGRICQHCDQDSSRYSDHAGQVALMSGLECSIGIIACSLPPLRMLFRQFFKGSSNQSHPQYDSTSDVSKKIGFLGSGTKD